MIKKQNKNYYEYITTIFNFNILNLKYKFFSTHFKGATELGLVHMIRGSNLDSLLGHGATIRYFKGAPALPAAP
jgi:hypothetical protein